MCRWEELTLCAPDPSRTSSVQDDGVSGFGGGFRVLAAVLGFGGDFGVLAGWRALLAWTAGGGCPHVGHVGLEDYDYYGDCGQGC
jgi:hypothetical protein